MGDFSLVAEARSQGGKGVARKLRAAGRIPAVFYGPGKESRSLTVDPQHLDQILRKSGSGMNTLIDLKIEGEKGDVVVLVKELQRDPIHGVTLHADLYAVNLQNRITVEVPIHLIGTATGVTLGGGILDQTLREIEVECLPTTIPGSIEIDVSALEIGDSIHVRDLTLPEGVELRSDAGLSVAAVVAPTVEAEPEVEEVAEGEELPEGAEPTAEGAEGEASPEKAETGDKGNS